MQKKSEANLKTSIFIEPDIRKLITNDNFRENLNPLKMLTIRVSYQNFMGSYRAKQY